MPPASASASSAAPPSPSAQSQASDVSTTSWMRMLSSTFLGDATALFSRHPATPRGTARATPKDSDAGRSRLTIESTPTFKIALVGGSAVGKTSIVRRWTRRSFSSQYSPTIGVDVHSLRLPHRRGDVIVQLWDVSSVEVDNTQSSLHALICDELDGIFFVCNVHRVSSIAAIDKWRHSLGKYISAREIPFFLLCHKADMIQKRIMSSDDIGAYAKAAGYRGWMWTVGRPSFGENEKHPAVMAALERMVECVLQERQLQPRTVSGHKSVFDVTNSMDGNSLEIIHVDDDLHDFSASLLRIPTKTITTLPRDENLLPIEETFETRSNQPPTARTSLGFGGNWMLGSDKGLYLHVTEDSVVAKDDASESEDEDETKQDTDAQNEEADQASENESDDDDDDENSEGGDERPADSERPTESHQDSDDKRGEGRETGDGRS
ncbi:hypothetical protein PINS_up005587 [Pythium insidiosum]|nr:hypothetical protein PINS_up005587 [Pythium insidiosum]